MITVKTVSDDRAHIDYTRDNRGVRVWKDRCQVIVRDGAGSEWRVIERAWPIPHNDDFSDPPSRNSLLLLLDRSTLECEELERLVDGTVPFGEAIR